MKLEVGQVWYCNDGHLEIVLGIDEKNKQVKMMCYEDGSPKPLTLDYHYDPMDVVTLGEMDETWDFTLASTLNDILEICNNERR